MNSTFSNVCCDWLLGKLMGIRAIKSAYIYNFKNKLTTFSAFSGFATAWAEVLCPAYVQGSKVLFLSKLLHYSSVSGYSLRQDLQHFTRDYPPVVKLLTTIPFIFSLVSPMSMFLFHTSRTRSSQSFMHISGTNMKHSSTLSYWIMLWFCPCGVLRRGMLNCTITPFLKKHDTQGFSSQCGAGPGLHQDLRMRHSHRAYSWDTLYVPQVLSIRARFKPFCILEQSWVCSSTC